MNRKNKYEFLWRSISHSFLHSNKKQSIFIFLFWIVSFIPSSAQWITVNVNTTQDLYSVNYFSTNDIWIGSFNQFIRTNNNGTTWTVVNPILDSFSGSIVGNMNDIELINSTTALATGYFYLGNSEVILRTTNTGANWDWASLNNSGGIPRYINSIDRNGAVCIAVGNKGRIGRSTDFGATWTFVSSGTTNLINDVTFLNATTVIAVGTNIILKSIDAGLTWTRLTINGTFHSLSCKQNTIYAGLEYTDTLYKSIDAGQTYTRLPLPFNTLGVVYAISADTVLVSGYNGLYKSVDGGQSWEKYILNTYQKIQMMSFLNSSSGIAVGDSGYVIRTNNFSGIPTLPIPQFSLPGGTYYCKGDSLLPRNLTAAVPGYTYSWKIDNTIFGSQYSAGMKLNSQGTHTISLTVSNSNGSVTISQAITVVGHTTLNFSMQSMPSSNCSGNVAKYIIPNSLNGVTYRFRQGYSNIGNLQNGNGGTLTFISTVVVSSPTVYNVIATKVSGCFTDSTIVYSTFTPLIGGPKAACSPTGSYSAGITNVTFNTINNTSAYNVGHYSNYACQMNTNVLVGNTYTISISSSDPGWCAVWIDYDTSGTFLPSEKVYYNYFTAGVSTGTITIPPTYRNFNTPLRMRVGYDRSSFSLTASCGGGSNDGEIEDYSLTVSMAPIAPTAIFSYTPTTTCSTSVVFSNSTFNSVNYLWDFGDGNTSNTHAPTHVYSSTGNYTVTLIATNAFGSDTARQVISVQNPYVPATASCVPTAYPLACTRILVSGVQVQKTGYFYSVLTTATAFAIDLTCTRQAQLIVDSSYNLTYALRQIGSTNCSGTSCAWIDWNNDGVLNDTDERLYSGNIGGCPAVFLPFTVPPTATLNTPLRVRIIGSANSIANSCSSACGEYVDFSVIVNGYLPITPDFTVSQTTACAPAIISFTNTTTNAISYTWDFGDGTTSSVANPSHIYSAPGIYSIKLVACNSSGNCDSLLRSAYIRVTPTQFITNSIICFGQTYTVGTNTYSVVGTYTDSLQAISGCDSIVTTNLTISPLPVVTISATGPTSFCQGDSVTLNSSAGLSAWQWYRFNTLLPGSTNSSFTANLRGNYRCIANNSAQCLGTSNVISVSVPCMPANPFYLKTASTSETGEEVFRVFPNPSTGIFYIQAPEGKLEIFSYTGALILTKHIEEGINEIDLSEIRNGVYLVTVTNEGAKYVKSIIVSNEFD